MQAGRKPLKLQSFGGRNGSITYTCIRLQCARTEHEERSVHVAESRTHGRAGQRQIDCGRDAARAGRAGHRGRRSGPHAHGAGPAVFAAIVERFGPEVVGPDGRLNRARLADLAFRHGHLQELNAIVHPPVIELQTRWMNEVFGRDPSAVAVIESALIFEVVRDARARGENDGILANWRRRIDRIIVVTAPDELKIHRYAARIQACRSGLAAGTKPGSHRGRCAQSPRAPGSGCRKNRAGR